MTRFLRFVAGMSLASAICAQDSLAAGPPIELTLSGGQSTQIPGINLTIEAIQVRDLTSKGCLGGANGCPDSVQLSIVQATQRQEFTLHVAHTQTQRTQRLHQAAVFGYRITLEAVRDGRATLSIDRP